MYYFIKIKIHFWNCAVHFNMVLLCIVKWAIWLWHWCCAKFYICNMNDIKLWTWLSHHLYYSLLQLSRIREYRIGSVSLSIHHSVWWTLSHIHPWWLDWFFQIGYHDQVLWASDACMKNIIWFCAKFKDCMA